MFPQHHFTVEDVVADGDKAAARWTMTAVNTAPIAGVPPAGRPITNSAIVFYRFHENRIAELWLQMDQAGVLRPPRLTDGPARGNLNVVGGHLARGLTITRADAFMLTEAAAPHYVRQLVGLSN